MLAAAHALERDAVHLVVGAELHAGELHAHIAHRAAVVVRVVAAVDAGVAFALAFAALEVHRRAAVDDDAAPVAACARADRLVAREDDGLLTRAKRHDAAAATDDERPHAARLADDAGALLDVQGGPVFDEDGTAKHVVVVVRPALGAGDRAGDDDDRLVDAGDVHRWRLVGRDLRDLCNGQGREEREPADSA